MKKLDKTVIVSDDCPHCKRVADNIQKKKLPYKIVNFKTDEGRKLVQDLNIRAVPTCVIVDEEGKVRRCTDSEDEDMW